MVMVRLNRNGSMELEVVSILQASIHLSMCISCDHLERWIEVFLEEPVDIHKCVFLDFATLCFNSSVRVVDACMFSRIGPAPYASKSAISVVASRGLTGDSV